MLDMFLTQSVHLLLFSENCRALKGPASPGAERQDEGEPTQSVKGENPPSVSPSFRKERMIRWFCIAQNHLTPAEMFYLILIWHIITLLPSDH